LVKKFKKKQEKQTSKEKPSEPEKLGKIKPSLVSWIVFFFTITMVIISLIPVVFPVLIVTSLTTVNILEQLGISGTSVEPFETGPLAAPLFITSGIVFGLAILHFKNKVPQLSKAFQFIFDFEVSRKTALVTMIVILSIYIIASAGELAEEETWEDYIKTKERWKILKEYFETNGIEFREVLSETGSVLTKLIGLIYILDYSTIYLAVKNKIDPSPINSIDFIKSKLN